MKYEYTIKVFSVQGLEESGVVDAPAQEHHVCVQAQGTCEVHDIGVEQMENLSSLFNEMGEEGWELVQLFFHQSGIVSFWKRVVKG